MKNVACSITGSGAYKLGVQEAMSTNWKVADLSKIRKLRSAAQGKKAHNALKAVKKSSGNAKKSVGDIGKIAKDEPGA